MVNNPSQQDSTGEEDLRSSISAYLPIDRRMAIASNKAMPDRAEGTALFADISGFTPLSADLAKELGPQRGAEELTLHLNHVTSVLIALVHNYHGSVVGFAGDAITCWFDKATESIQDIKHSVRLAATCSLEMQRAMETFETINTPSGSLINFRIKVAITAGSLRRFRVDNPENRYIDALAGGLLDRLSALEQQAVQGEVVIDDSIVEHLENRTIQTQTRQAKGDIKVVKLTNIRHPSGPQPWPQPPVLSTKTAGDWLLKPVLQRLIRGEGDFLSELRLATNLFVGFDGPDYDGDDEAGGKLDYYIRWAQHVVTQHGGYLIDLTIGDKGNYLHASFGAPSAHEDDSNRAISAAFELQKPPRELGVTEDIRIGLSRGMIRAGAYGSRSRRAYSVHGDQVNLAARLMNEAGSGRIFVTESVAKDASDIARFLDLGQRPIKGLDMPVSIFEPKDRRFQMQALAGMEGMLTPIFGRKSERAGFADQLRALQKGQSSIAIVEGEAGIGKTRLMEDFVAQAYEHGIPTLIGAGRAIERTTAYHAWRPIFQDLVGVNEGDSSDFIRETVLARLADDPRLLDRIPLLNPVLPMNLPDNNLTSGMSGEVRADNTGLILVQLLERSREISKPLLLVFDDAHWLDSASWSLLDRVSRESNDLLLLLVTRPADQSIKSKSLLNAYHNYLESPQTEHYQLGVMSEDETLALVRRRLGVEQLPTAISDLIRKKAEGHPFYSEEIAFALRDAGLIRVERGKLIITTDADLRHLDYPETIQGFLTSRIDRLDPGAEMTLKVASVIGRIFLFRTLQKIHPIKSDLPHLKEYLNTLDRLDITPLETHEPELAYVFRHAITQEVAYSLLLYQQRRELHKAVAEWYEETYLDGLAHYYPLLAYHWQEAEIIPKAIVYLEKAAEQALRTYANREAVEFLTKLLSLPNGNIRSSGTINQPQRQFRKARWLRQLGEGYLGLGRLNESRMALDRVLSLLGRPVPASGIKLAASLGRQLIEQLLHRLLPSLYLSRSSERERAILLEAVKAYQQLAEIYYFANERAHTLNAGLNVLNLSERAGPSPELARAYANMVVIAGLIPWHSVAKAYIRLTMETTKADGDVSALIWINLLLGTYHVGLGHWNETITFSNEAIEHADKLGDWRLLGLSLGLLALVPTLQGDFGEGRKLYARWHKIAVDNSNLQHQAFGLFGQAENILPTGQLDLAVHIVETGLKLLIEESEQTFENRGWEIRGYGLLAVGKLRQGDYQGALEAANDAVDIIVQLSTPTLVILLEGLSSVAETFLSLWEDATESSANTPTETLRSSAKQACKFLRQYARIFAIGEPRANLWLGSYHWLDGQQQKAHKAWRKSKAAAIALHMPYDLALANYEIGRHSSDSQRETSLLQAEEVFQSIGAAYNLANIRALQGIGPQASGLRIK